jgi:NAD+ kinase
MQYQVLNEVMMDRGLLTPVQCECLPGQTHHHSAEQWQAVQHIWPQLVPPLSTPTCQSHGHAHCPYSLSFQPIMVPDRDQAEDYAVIGSRNTTWVSFYRWKRQEIRHGDSISITTLCYTLPSICIQDPIRDCLKSLT